MKHALSWALMIGLTLLAFFAVGFRWMEPPMLIIFLLFLAAIQIYLQVYSYMHLNNRSVAYPAFFMMSGFLIGLIIVLSLKELIWL